MSYLFGKLCDQGIPWHWKNDVRSWFKAARNFVFTLDSNQTLISHCLLNFIFLSFILTASADFLCNIIWCINYAGGAWRRRWPACAGSLSPQKIFKSVTVITSWTIISWKPPTVPQIFWSATKKMNTKQVLMVCVRLGSIRSARLILTFYPFQNLSILGA